MRLVQLLLLVGWAGVFLDPPPADVLVERATAAAQKLETAYRQVRVTTRETRYTENRDRLFVNECEYLVDGDLFRALVTVLETKEAGVEVGATYAFGGSSADYFNISKQQKSSGYVVNALGEKPNDAFEWIRRDKARPIFAPYCMWANRLVDVLQHPGFQILSIEETLLDSQAVVDVRADYAFPATRDWAAGTTHYRFYFDSQSWILTGFVVYNDPGDPRASVLHQRITYEAGTTPPRVRQVETWAELPLKPGEKLAGTIWEVTSLEFGRIDPEEFTLAAFDIEGPVHIAQAISAAKRSYWQKIYVAGGFLALGLVLAGLAIRHRRRSKAVGSR